MESGSLIEWGLEIPRDYFIEKEDSFGCELRIVKHGYDLRTKNIRKVIRHSFGDRNTVWKLMIKYLVDGRSVYSLLSDVEYNWSRVLHYIEILRLREKRYISSIS